MTDRPIRYCKRCLEPDTRPDCVFDDEGICFPCRYYETIHEIDWDARRRELNELVEWGKARNVSGYDCLISVSGGKDSLRQALICRDELGMNPLLVSSVFPPEQLTERGAYNLANLISLGFDCLFVNAGPETWRSMVREGFLRWGNLNKSTEMLLFVVAPRIAITYHIPLIVYGENPALQWGSAGGSLDGDANLMKNCNTVKGGDISWMFEAGADPSSMYWYTYPSEKEFDRANLRMIYLGYYVEDFNDFVNGPVAVENGLICREGFDAEPENIGQITPFDALDCDFISVNQMLKQFKLGFGKASEQCSGAVRAGQMTREEALDLTLRYDGKCSPRYIRRFCNYIGVNEEEFWDVAERYRNLDLWEPDGNDWRLKHPPE